MHLSLNAALWITFIAWQIPFSSLTKVKKPSKRSGVLVRPLGGGIDSYGDYYPTEYDEVQ